MIDIEKFLVSLRSNKDLDGKLKPICLADTVQEEIRIIQAAVENSRREWVVLTDADIAKAMHGSVEGSNMLPYQFARAVEAKLKEKNT
jgi:quinolinate synthase